MMRACLIAVLGALLVAAPLSAQDQGPYPRLPGPPVKSPPDTSAPNIPGVVAQGTPVHLVRDLFHSTEGPIAMPDGSLLFTEQDAGDGRLVKIDKDDTVSVFIDNTNRTIGLAYDPKGRLVGAQSNIPRIAVLAPVRQTLVDQYQGIPLVAPNDIAADSKGGFYFSDPLGSRFRPTPAGRTAPMLFYIRPDGTLVKVTEQVTRPNGVVLSPDEKTLYASNGPTIAAFDVLANNTDGRAIVNRNDLATGMKQIIRDASGYYLLGYNSSQAPRDGRFHEIKVKVKRPGVQVRSRKGFWAYTAEDARRALAPAKEGPRAFSEKREPQFRGR